MGGDAILNGHLPARHGRCDGEGTGHDAVWHGRVSHRLKGVDADDLDGRSAGAGDACPHVVEHRRDVDDFRFTCGVIDDSRALGQHRGHQHRLGRPHTREVEPDRAAVQPVIGPGDEVAVLRVDARAKLG